MYLTSNYMGFSQGHFLSYVALGLFSYMFRPVPQSTICTVPVPIHLVEGLGWGLAGIGRGCFQFLAPSRVDLDLKQPRLITLHSTLEEN